MINFEHSVLLQEAIRQKKAKSYLEIGVYKGDCFMAIKAPSMVAVDPEMLIPEDKRKKAWKKDFPYIMSRKYIEATSDDFFKVQAPVLYKRHPIDVAFVDGLHTYEQTVIDVENCLTYLANDGFIMMHDCSPPNEAAAYRAMSLKEVFDANPPGFTGSWCGDVWKSVLHLRATHSDLEVCVLDCDFGLGLVKRAKKEVPKLQLSIDEIASMPYSRFDADRKSLLNLEKPDYFFDFLGLKKPS